uniref:Transmembrane protein 81 n=1 Tax=Leptobrachium leishanense TaxID=445787 RepID=A0A8C5LUN5_9ANUR
LLVLLYASTIRSTGLASIVYDPVLENLKYVTIPEQLKGVSVKMIIKSSPCSVTCGVGSKLEKQCIVDKYGIRSDCEEVQVKCVATWFCGMFTYTLRLGQSFTMDCLSRDDYGAANQGVLYFWKIARGILTADDMLFELLETRTFSVTLSSIMEKDAGTYRCDVQNYYDQKLLKRIYYGIKVISPATFDLDYDKYLINKGQMETLAGQNSMTSNGNDTEERIQMFSNRMYFIVGIGSGVGILAGIILAVVLFRLKPPGLLYML